MVECGQVNNKHFYITCYSKLGNPYRRPLCNLVTNANDTNCEYHRVEGNLERYFFCNEKLGFDVFNVRENNFSVYQDKCRNDHGSDYSGVGLITQTVNGIINYVANIQ